MTFSKPIRGQAPWAAQRELRGGAASDLLPVLLAAHTTRAERASTSRVFAALESRRAFKYTTPPPFQLHNTIVTFQRDSFTTISGQPYCSLYRAVDLCALKVSYNARSIPTPFARPCLPLT